MFNPKIPKIATHPQPLPFITSILLITLLTLIPISNQSQPCKNIQLSGYKFNLQQLSTVADLNTISGSQFISISFCKLITCPSSSIPTNSSTISTANSKNGYVLVKKNQTSCIPYTSNQTGPLKQSYKLINQTKPDTGIIIQYIPSYITTYTSNNQTLVLQNQTINYINITQNNYQNNVRLLLYCKSDGNIQVSCQRYEKIVGNYSKNSTYYIYNYYNTLICSLYMRQGCPILAVNNYWQYLIHNKIIFAIVLWICALFLLLFGYLAIRITILLYGTFAGSFFGIVFLAQNYNNFYFQTNGIYIFTICLSIGMGLLYGITLLTVPKLGYINIGIVVAALFSLLMQNSVLFLTGSLLAFYITFGVCALIMAIIAMMELRYFIIICSSFTGAFLFIRPLGFLLPGYPNQLISGKNFLISVKTPWQFYLYLISILVLTGLGIAIQRCINKKMGKNRDANQNYYLEQDGSVRDKLKKIFEFKEIKDMIKAGKKQFVQLKNMITDQKYVEENQPFQPIDQDDHGNYIEMEKMEKLQKKAKQQKQKEKEKIKEKEKKSSSKQITKKQTEEVSPIDVDDYLEQIRDSDSVQGTKVVKISRAKNK